jgi:glycosyltransferase involved in cell wall biosynthesis
MDIIHVHHPFLSGRLALRYAQPAGIPIVFTNHTRYDLYARAYLPMMPDQMGATLLHAYLPVFCAEVDMVIAPSHGLKQVLRELEVKSEIKIIPNGVRLEPFDKVKQPKSRAPFGFTPEDIVLIYSGRLGPEKNLIFLLRAFAGVHRAFRNSKLVLIGKGPEMDNLKDFVRRSDLSQSVHFTGFVSYEEVPQYLAMADIFVTASVTEVHPLSVIEAMATGLPVVGIESPGVGDIVQHGENGMLASHDMASFASVLSRMLAEEVIRFECGQRARAAARQYDIERTTTLLEQAYEELIAGHIDHQHSLIQALWARLLGRD